MRVHQEFAKDFEKLGNEPMAQYHLDKAISEQQQQDVEECGLFCSLFDALLDSGPDSSSSTRSCRDPVTSPPSLPPRC